MRDKFTIIHFLLFLVASQAYPFVHIHDHHNSGVSKLEICVHPPNQIQHDNHACQEFFSDHQRFEVDWDRVKIYVKTNKFSEKYFIKFVSNDFSDNNNLNIFLFSFYNTLNKTEYFSRISNKSPPFLF